MSSPLVASTLTQFAITRVLTSPVMALTPTGDWIGFAKQPSGQTRPQEMYDLGPTVGGDKIFNEFWKWDYIFKGLTKTWFDEISALVDIVNQDVLLNRPAMSIGATAGVYSWIYGPAKLSSVLLWSNPEDMAGDKPKNITLSFNNIVEYLRGSPGMPTLL